MAFSLQFKLDEVEYRACRSGTSSKGNVWMTLVFEDFDSNQIEASVPADIQSEIYSLGLQRGDMCSVRIRAVARADGNSYIQLLEKPTPIDAGVDF